jgi:hypothetical protein
MQKNGFEKANYKPTYRILKDLYSYNAVFERESKPEIFDMLKHYNEKLIILNNLSHLNDSIV